MRMTPRMRKIALTAHVTASMGWVGAVLAFLALAVVGVASADVAMVRAVDLLAFPMAWFAVVPLAFASLLTGLVSSLGTRWGLIRHHWVALKLALNVLATLVLLAYTQTIGSYRAAAARPQAALAELRAPTFVIHSAAALLVLLVAVVLAIYKPRGLTRYGARRQAAVGH